MIDIYVDGSFYENKITSSFLIVENNNILHQETHQITNPEYLKHRQISGELFSVIKAMEYCIKNNIKQINICYDYFGIEKWVKKEWRAKTELTREYVKNFNELKSNFDEIKFTKIKAHSNNQFNNLVDQLTKKETT